MAIPIKQVPILTGELAENFIRMAEENAQRPHRRNSPEDEREVAEMVRLSKEFIPSWRR